MTFLYLDASALLRPLLEQRGPRAPLSGAHALSSRLLEVEAHRAIERLRLAGAIDDAQRAAKTRLLVDLLEAVSLIPVGDEVVALARADFGVNVRALDAIHVATAQVAERGFGPMEFWTHDSRQAIAAIARGLAVRGV